MHQESSPKCSFSHLLLGHCLMMQFNVRPVYRALFPFSSDRIQVELQTDLRPLH